MVGAYRVWLVHGHRHSVYHDLNVIRNEAVRKGAHIVMYGHTHQPAIDIRPDIITLNPGSLSYPRQDGRKPSYIIMEIDKEGEVHFTVGYL
jgi:putative phosphoesterase